MAFRPCSCVIGNPPKKVRTSIACCARHKQEHNSREEREFGGPNGLEPKKAKRG